MKNGNSSSFARRDRTASPRASHPEKPLPHNAESEQAILGAIILDNAALAKVRSLITPSVFFTPRGSSGQNKVIYDAMLKMADQGDAIDIVSMVDYLTRFDLLAAAGGDGYIAQLIDGRYKAANVEQYCKTVVEAAQRRSLLYTAELLHQQAMDGTLPVEDIQRALLRAASIEHKPTNGNGNSRIGMSLSDFVGATFPECEHLITGLIPSKGSILIVALPHRLKSWFTAGMALGATVAGMALGSLEVLRPVRTVIVQVEDPDSVFQWRLRELIKSPQFAGCTMDNVWVVSRKDFADGFTAAWFEKFLHEIREWKADHVIFDVLRRFFAGRGDINSPSDSAEFLEDIDRIRDEAGAAVTLVHHENKKEAELMAAAAGSYNFAGWANVVIQIKRKKEEKGTTHVEIEVDNKLASSPEPMRMILDLQSPVMPLRMELLEDSDDDFREACKHLQGAWNRRDLEDCLGISKANAYRRMDKWESDGKIAKISAGNKGRGGGLARYEFVLHADPDDAPKPVRTRRVN